MAEEWLYQRDDSDDGEIYWSIHRASDYEFIGNIYSSEKDAKDIVDTHNAAHAQLTAQKAAHAKMLRDMCAAFRGDWQAELCRLADKIEGRE